MDSFKLKINDEKYLNRLEIAKETLRHTELKLSSCENNAKISDSRFFQLSAGLIVIVAAILTSNSQYDSNALERISASVLLVVSFYSFWSVRPATFFTVGGSYDAWEGHISKGGFEEDDDIINVIISQAEENDRRIYNNQKKLKENARKFNFLMVVSTITLASYLVKYLDVVSLFQSMCAVI